MGKGLANGNEGRSKYIPGYRRIEQDLRQRIRSGHWQPGALLPSRRELALEYNVDVNTLQRAVSPLLQDGTLCANGNRGTFVADSGSIVEREVASTIGNLSTARGNGPAFRTAVGIVAAVDPDSAWVRAIVHGLEGTLAENGIRSLYSDIQHVGDDEASIGTCIKEAALRLLADDVDALLVVGIYDTPGLTEAMVSLLSLTRVPLVFLSWHDTRRPMHHAFYDSQFAGYQAAEHLLLKGWSHLLFLAPFTADWVRERIETARIAVNDAGLPASVFTVYPGREGADITARPEDHTASGYAIFQQALQEGIPLDGAGMIAPNDRVAYGILQAAREAGKVVGRDFGLIGFDDDVESRSLGLTTLRPPLESLGMEGGKLMLRAIDGERSPIQIRLHSRVIARATT